MLEHELGHVLGLPDNAEAGDLMDITLGLGVRLAPMDEDVAAIVSPSGTRSSLSTASVTPATVDAALAVIMNPVDANGDGPKPTTIDDSIARISGRLWYLKVANRRKKQTSQSSPRTFDGVVSSRFASRMINAEIRKDRPG